MISCEHCNGQIQPDGDGASCLQCGRRLYWNANVRDVRVSEILQCIPISRRDMLNLNAYSEPMDVSGFRKGLSAS